MMSGSKDTSSPGTTPPDPGKDSDEVTVRQLEDRSNRASWRFMYVFMGLVVTVTVVIGIGMAMTQNSS